jgi:hypothetical protein
MIFALSSVFQKTNFLLSARWGSLGDQWIRQSSPGELKLSVFGR